MGRRNRREEIPEPGEIKLGGFRRSESHSDGEWIVQQLTGSSATKPYIDVRDAIMKSLLEFHTLWRGVTQTWTDAGTGTRHVGVIDTIDEQVADND